MRVLSVVRSWCRRRTACVISGGTVGGSPFLFKNRDRMYDPSVKITHDLLEGVEVIYYEDLETGWVEGINEYGIAIVNSALRVGFDEKEKEIVKKTGQKSKDRKKILKALTQKTILDAVEVLCSFMGGASGHTLVADKENLFTLESTKQHECVKRKQNINRLYVRTNHGYAYQDAGYTKGPDFLSSVKRRNKAKKCIKDCVSIEDIALSMMKARGEDLADPYNMVRDIPDKMRTTSQVLFDLSKKRMIFYMIPNHITLEEVVVSNKVKNPKCSFVLKTYRNVQDVDNVSLKNLKR